MVEDGEYFRRVDVGRPTSFSQECKTKKIFRNFVVFGYIYISINEYALQK